MGAIQTRVSVFLVRWLDGYMMITLTQNRTIAVQFIGGNHTAFFNVVDNESLQRIG